MNRSYYFVRHARAVYQHKGFRWEDYPPGTDWPLSSTGEAQAEEAAGKVLAHGIGRVVSSKLARAVSTASAIAQHGALPYEHQWGALNEIHPRVLRDGHEGAKWSFWEGWRAARAVKRYVRTGQVGKTYDPRAVEDRVRGALARLDELEEDRVAVVSHGFFILLGALFVGGEVRYRWIDNCSITRIDADGRGDYRLVAFAQRTLAGKR